MFSFYTLMHLYKKWRLLGTMFANAKDPVFGIYVLINIRLNNNTGSEAASTFCNDKHFALGTPVGDTSANNIASHALTQESTPTQHDAVQSEQINDQYLRPTSISAY